MAIPGTQRTVPVVRDRMKIPRAAAVAGIVFSLLLAATLVLLHLSVPPVSKVGDAWPAAGRSAVVLALSMAPFTGVAFLWFIGVIRERLGVSEDRFFATVFLGSGILFLAMFFAAAAVGGAVLVTWDREPRLLMESGGYVLGRAVAAQLMNVYAHKMAGVFMFSTATLIVRTRILPLWTAILGFVLALLLMLTSHFYDWLGLAFPLWVFILGLCILGDELRDLNTTQRQPAVGEASGEESVAANADGPARPR